MNLTAHLPALQVIVPMLAAPLVLLLKPRGLAWAGATSATASPEPTMPPSVLRSSVRSARWSMTGMPRTNWRGPSCSASSPT